MAYVYFVLTAILFGSNFKLMHEATQVFDPSFVALGRLGGGALALLLAWWLGPQHWRPSAREWKWLGATALLGNALPFVLMPLLLQLKIEHSFLAMFVPFTPLLTIAVSLPLLGIRPTPRQFIGVTIGLATLWFITGDGASHGASLLHVLLAFVVPLCYAISNTLIRRELSGAAPLPLSALITSCATMMVLPVVAWQSTDSIFSTSLSSGEAISATQMARAVGALVFLGLIGTGVAVGLFVTLVQMRGPLFAGMVTYLVPPIALVWGYLDNETVTTGQVIAIGVILAMVALVQYNPQPSGATGSIPREEPSQSKA